MYLRLDMQPAGARLQILGILDGDGLYLDMDRDNDLSNDPVILWQPDGCSFPLHFYHCNHTIPLDCCIRPWPQVQSWTRRVGIYVSYARGRSRGTRGDVFLRGYWTGHINTNEGMMRFVLMDTNANDRYSDPEDKVALDVVGMGRDFQPWNPGFREAMFPIRKPVEIASKLYLLKPNSDGSSLRVDVSNRSYTPTSHRVSHKVD